MKTISKQTVIADILPFISNGVFIVSYLDTVNPAVVLECSDKRLSFILTDVVTTLPNNQHRREQFYYNKEIPQFKAAVDNFIKLVEMNGGNYYSEEGITYFILQYHERFCVFRMALYQPELNTKDSSKLEESLEIPPPVQYRNAVIDERDKLPPYRYHGTLFGTYDSLGHYLINKLSEFVIVAALAFILVKLIS